MHCAVPAFGLIVAALTLAACDVARAQSGDDRTAIRLAALDAREASISSPTSLPSEPLCPANTIPYGPHGDLCLARCNMEAECAAEERCRIVPFQPRLGDPVVFAGDIEDEIAEALAIRTELDEEPVFADPPVCEGNCSAHTPELPIGHLVPSGFCDPFWWETDWRNIDS